MGVARAGWGKRDMVRCLILLPQSLTFKLFFGGWFSHSKGPKAESLSFSTREIDEVIRSFGHP